MKGCKRLVYRDYGTMYAFRIPETATDYSFDEKWDYEHDEEKPVCVHLVFVLNGKLVWQKAGYKNKNYIGKIKNVIPKRLNAHNKYKHVTNPQYENRYIGEMDDDIHLWRARQTTKFCPHCMENTFCIVEKRKEKYNWKNEGDIEILANVVVCGKCGEEIWDYEYDSKNIEMVKRIYERRKAE